MNRTARVIVCSSVLKKFLGLMFSKKKNLLFVFDCEKRISLHMLFVFYPILVVFLDKKMFVVEKKILKPFTFYTPKYKAKFVLEFAEKEAINAFKNIKVGEKFKFY
ncbi:MAG: DUF192 domain-containing protein [Candidatus Woesearchaeota archaeon]